MLMVLHFQGSCNGNSDHLAIEDIEEEEPSEGEGSKRLPQTQKSPSDYPTDMSDTTQSEENLEGSGSIS